VCKARKNALLPVLTNSLHAGRLDKESTTALREFFEAISMVTDEAGRSPVDVAIQGLAGLLRMIEIRHRSRPEIVRKESLQLLVRHLYIAIYFYLRNAQRMGGNYHFDNTTLRTPEEFILTTFLVSGVMQHGFWGVSRQLNPNPVQMRLILILYACLFLGDDLNMNWVEYMAPNKYFGPQLANQKLAEFVIDLPERFEDLRRAPFNLAIDDQKRSVGYCLLTKRPILLAGEEDKMLTVETLLEDLHDGVSLILATSGPGVSAIFFASFYPQIVAVLLPSVYVDADGNPDHGFAGVSPLRLDRERLEKYIDALITGEWIGRAMPTQQYGLN
jgi:hypothetical protein